jgi:hypothetical protein
MFWKLVTLRARHEEKQLDYAQMDIYSLISTTIIENQVIQGNHAHFTKGKK